MKTSHRILSLVLTAVMLFGILPVISLPADAVSAGEYLEVWLGAGRIGNANYGATNLLDNLQTAKDSGLITISARDAYELSGNQLRANVRDSSTYTIKLNMDNPVIKALSQSPTAQYRIWIKAVASCRDYHTSKAHYDRDGMVGNAVRNPGNSYSVDSGTKNRDGAVAGCLWRPFYNTKELYFSCRTYRNHGCGYGGVDPDGPGDYARIEVGLYILDRGVPVINGYSGSTSATVNASNNKQLLAKLGVNNNAGGNPENYYYDFSQYNSAGTAAANSREWIDQSFTFSKPVTAGSLGGNSGSIQQMSGSEYSAFANHTLFTNTVGTGFVNAGQPCNLALQDSIGTVSGSFISSLRYRYTVRYGDFSGNNPIPAGGGIITSAGYSYGASLLSKILAAGFHDAAGNPVRDVSLSSGATNIFDRNLGGYDVIVDAVPPTYSRVGNGIYPDILTDVILNKNDTVDFIVSFSEAVIAKKGWSDSNTYLLLDNGGRANFVSKSSDGKRWTFRYTVPSGNGAEATLLKVIAVLNTALGTPNGGNGAVSSGSDYAAYSYNYDGRAITDFVGNMMVERANADPTRNTKQINSYTGWAGLAVDNTPPTIAFRYMPYGSGILTHPADANKWGQAVTLYTSATDPDVPVAKYDPSYSSSNTSRPSKGIYRPDNTTGNAGSAVGLIFYTWTRSATPPSTGQNFEAIKRYSLTGIQPRDVEGKTYTSAWADYTLTMANNYQNILPPDDAMTSDGDGAWYLHVWTADMSWDSARQLMQYKLAQSAQYNYDGNGKLYDAQSMLRFKAEKIELSRFGDAPSYATAWDKVKAEVYNTVYKTQFRNWLKAYDPSNADSMYLDAAYDYAMEQATAQVRADTASIYNSGYDASSMLDDAGSYKQTQIQNYITAHTPSAVAAWSAVESKLYADAFSEEVNDWITDKQEAGQSVSLAYNASADAVEALVENYVLEKVKYAEDKDGKLYTDETIADYRAEKYETELAAAIETYKEENKTQKLDHGEPVYDNGEPVYEYPTDDEAEAAVKDDVEILVRKDVYTTVYTTTFLYALTDTDNADDLDEALDADDPYTDAAMTAALPAAAAQFYGEAESGKHTAQTFVTLRQDSIQTYVTDNTPSEEQAWEAVETVGGKDVYVVKEAVYTAVYLPSYIAALDASGFGRYSEAAQIYVYDHRAAALVFNSGYDADKAAAFKQSKITAYIDAHTTVKPAGSNVSYDDSWKAVRADVYQQAYTTQFLCWLAKIDQSDPNKEQLLKTALTQDAMYTDAAMIYARSQATLTQAQYDNTKIWTLDMFAKDDSNWTLSSTRVLLDNTAPVTSYFGNVTGNNTVAATMVATIADTGSGLDLSTIEYQWAAKGASLGIDWQTVTGASFTEISGGFSGAAYGKATATFTAKTEEHVFDSGEYILYIRCADIAGNTVILNSGDNTVKVNMNNNIRCEFGPENADTTYQKNVIPEATVTGMLINEVVYAVSRDSDRPTDGYAALLPINADDDKMEYTYELPALTGADGVWYVHILATGNTGDEQYFRGVYLLDRTVPELHFNSLGLSEDGTSVNALIEIHDALSGESETAYYQILRGKTSPASDSEDWIEIPADGKITITGEPATYYIHVKASDLAGNEVIGVSAPFEVKEADPEPMVLPPYGCQLLTVEDGFGIANLLLETENKEGYRYSISVDGGQKWCNWLPYMSMIRIALPDDYMQPDLLQVKFRAPDGNVGVPRSLATGEMIEDAIYMTAEFDSTFKRQSGNDLTLITALPDEVEYTLEGADDWQTGDFTVTENGAYSFEMRKGTTSAATEFTVVVDIFDDVAPTARLTYSEIAPTASNVVVNVIADEPVFVRSLTVRPEGEAEFSASPKMQYAFEKNGTASFAISDEAGNITTLTATVGNIDRTPPRVKITENYDRYRVNGDFASGVTLVVEKESADDESFVVIGENPTNKIEVTENGTYSFTVRDAVGNVTAVSKTVTNIVRAIPDFVMTSTYATSGKPASADAPQKEDITVRLVFEPTADGRKLYFGTAPAADGSNELAKDGNGRYFATRTYTQNGNTLMVIADELGNNRRIPVTVEGIDKKAPTFKLQLDQAVIQPTDKKLSELSTGEIIEMFGGYTVYDNAYAPGDIVVKVSRSDDIIKTEENKGDISTPGVYTLIYTATDPAGNTARAEQSLVVIPGDGLLVQASGVVLSSAMSNTAIVPSNHVTFAVNPQRMQAMFYGTARQKVYNRAMRYDVYYVSGLYREGQLKTIAQKLTAEELLAKNFEVTFPKAGWYTIIIRNQERAREYTTFFVASYEK